MSTIASIGHTTLDMIFLLTDAHLHQVDLPFQELCLPFPSKSQVDKRVVSLGGNAPNAGAGLIKLGHRVKLVSQVGDDQLGNILLDLLRQHGFDLTYTSMGGESDTSVILSFGGDRTIMAYHANVEYYFPQTLSDVEWIYLSSLGPYEFRNLHSELMKWMIKNPGVKLVYNPGGAEIKSGLNQIKELCEFVHTFILNKEEAAQILGLDQTGEGDLKGVSSYMEKFLQAGVQHVIITDSKRGAFFANTIDDYYQVPALPDKAVDTTGAGDAFSSGYLGGLAQGKDVFEALKLAAAQSSNVITIPGATNGLLTMEELSEKLSRHPAVESQKMHV